VLINSRGRSNVRAVGILQAVAQTEVPLSDHQNVFCEQILAKWKISDVNCLSPKGEF